MDSLRNANLCTLLSGKDPDAVLNVQYKPSICAKSTEKETPVLPLVNLQTWFSIGLLLRGQIKVARNQLYTTVIYNVTAAWVFAAGSRIQNCTQRPAEISFYTVGCVPSSASLGIPAAASLWMSWFYCIFLATSHVSHCQVLIPWDQYVTNRNIFPNMLLFTQYSGGRWHNPCPSLSQRCLIGLRSGVSHASTTSSSKLYISHQWLPLAFKYMTICLEWNMIEIMSGGPVVKWLAC